MKTKLFKIQILLLMGLVAGLIQVLSGIILYLAGVYFTSWSSIVWLAILVLYIIFGVIWYRKKYMNGIANFSAILLIGLIISISVGIIYAIYNIISISYIYPDFINDMINGRVEILKNKGIDQNEIERIKVLMRERYTPLRIAITNLVTVPVYGFICSLVISFILKKKIPEDVPVRKI